MQVQWSTSLKIKVRFFVSLRFGVCGVFFFCLVGFLGFVVLGLFLKFYVFRKLWKRPLKESFIRFRRHYLYDLSYIYLESAPVFKKKNNILISKD